MPGRAQPLSLAELIDLECRLLADQQISPERLLARDRELAPRVLAPMRGGRAPARAEVLRRWLAEVGAREPGSAGVRVQTIYRLIAVGLVGLGVLSGAGTAAGLLHYDGSQPVNLARFFAVMAGLQIALAGLAVVRMLPRRWLPWLPGFGLIHELLRHLGYRRAGLEAWLVRLHGDAARVAGSLVRLSSWSTLYAEVERWLLLTLTQAAAVGFNLGALAVVLYLVTATDLAFAWSTTLDVAPATVARLLRVVALPWWWVSVAVPSEELVAASRHFRQSLAHDPALLKQWWAFLLAALVVYGLLPRLLLLGVAATNLRRARRRVRLDHGDCEALYERLTRSVSGWSSDSSKQNEQPAAGPRVSTGTHGDTGPPLASPGSSELACTAICWGDIPVTSEELAGIVRQRFGWDVGAMHALGGKVAGEQHGLLQALARGGADAPVLVIAEAWEAPGRAVRSVLRELRIGVGPRRPILVGLLGRRQDRWQTPAPADVALWRQVAAALGDPYLRVEPLVDP